MALIRVLPMIFAMFCFRVFALELAMILSSIFKEIFRVIVKVIFRVIFQEIILFFIIVESMEKLLQ